MTLNLQVFSSSIDRAAYIEKSAEAFNPKNWTVIGAEAVIKGTVHGEQNPYGSCIAL